MIGIRLFPAAVFFGSALGSISGVSPASSADACAEVENFDGRVYLAGDSAYQDSALWKANWYTTNQPAADDFAWTRVSDCEERATASCSAPIWDSATIYGTPMIVTHESALWKK